jgi:putative spermidine/putrescine transport system substrate-binding protein
MKGRSITTLGISVLLFSLPMWSTAAAQEVLRVTTWGGNYKATYESVVERFEKANNVKVEWIVGSTDSNHVKARQGQTDVATTDLLHSLAGEQEGLWVDLDPQLIPNLNDLYPIARRSKQTVFANVGDFVLAYNANRIKRAPTGWGDLWNPEYKNRVALYSFTASSTLSLIVLEAKKAGGSERNVEPGLKRLIDLHKSGNILALVAGESELVSLYELEEAWIGPLAVGRLKALWDKGAKHIKFVRPAEGTPGLITTLNVVKGSPKKELAMKFVNFALGKECQEAFAARNLYAPTLKTASIPRDLEGLLISGNSVDKLFIPDWVYINSVKAQWKEQWDKAISQ